ncbi:hypothetical protein [Paraburkholderia hospita]|uniref:hypothetical protein n=1 Tax=Paraburkholderia hospita TaxID=169430 RepID=UPI000B349B47|nr:hypothetical protein [Paraburkholderia hospita]OUL93274.1 hypothetical protein CA601_10490 [Paraburkholderia hospita]
MKGLLLTMLLCSALLSFGANAEESAQTVGTAGTAELEIVHDFFIVSTSTKIKVQVPQYVALGQLISIRYMKDGHVIDATFPVAQINIRNDLCWLHSKGHSALDPSLGDTIYVQPCRRLQ